MQPLLIVFIYAYITLAAWLFSHVNMYGSALNRLGSDCSMSIELFPVHRSLVCTCGPVLLIISSSQAFPNGKLRKLFFTSMFSKMSFPRTRFNL